MHPSLVPLYNTFLQYADSQEATKMAAYMKHQFVFLGIKAPIRKSISKEFISTAKGTDKAMPEVLIREMWDLEAREFQYTAGDSMIRHKRYAPASYLDLYECLIKEKSWWDTVDFLASHLVGGIFQRFPELIHERVESYMQSGNMWLQRTALLFQLKYKDQTDWDLLQALCLRCTESKEFFIQKAIGWALRQYSKFEPEKVLNFINAHELTNLSRREGLKHLHRLQ